MLVTVELRQHRFMDLPTTSQHVELIDKVVHHRSTSLEASVAQPIRITADDIKEALQEFSSNPYSNHANKRWLFDVLKVPKASRQDAEYLTQMLETAVDEFLQDLSAEARTHVVMSKNTLAMLALYHRILITWKLGINPKAMPLGPTFRLLANAERSIMLLL